MNTTRTQTVDITPTWSALMPALIELIRHGTPEGRWAATDELMRLAREVDRLNNERATS